MLGLLKAIEAEGRVRSLSDAEKAGLVQFFEMTIELGWKTLSDILRSQLVDVASSPLTIIRQAFASNLINDAELWLAGVERRNLMSHAYDPSAFEALVAEVGQRFLPVFDALVDRLSAERAA